MRLNDKLITSFTYKDKEYDIDLSFDNVLDVFEYLDNKYLFDHEKAILCLELLLGENTFDVEESIELWNHVYKEFIEIESKRPIPKDLKGNPMPINEEDEKRIIDLEKDAEHIYASFIQAYQIDLYEQQGKLHWSKFCALLNGLPSGTIMQRIIQIRLWKPSKHESKEYKESMRKLQQVYALEDDDDEEVDE